MPASAFTISPSAQNVIPSPYGRQRPWRQRTRSGRRSISSRNSQTSRLFPTPGSATTVTSCVDGSRRARANVSLSSASSESRPTKSVSARSSVSTPKRLRAVVARQTGIGSCLPFAATGSSGSKPIARSAERIVAASTITAPTGAAPCRRAAVLTTSPATIPSPRSGRAPRATTASPVVTAARTATSRPSPRKALHRLEDSQCRAHRTLGVVLVCDGRAEDRHDGVADELLDGPAEALDVGLHALVVRTQCRADVLRVGAVGAIGEADQVDEENGDDLALLARRGLGNERVAAGEAEARSLRILLAARGQTIIGGSSQRAGAASMRRAGAARPRPRRAVAAARCATGRRRGDGARRRPGTRSASSVSRKRNASSSGTSGPIVKCGASAIERSSVAVGSSPSAITSRTSVFRVTTPTRRSSSVT